MSNGWEPSSLDTLDENTVLVLGGLERTGRFRHSVFMCMQFEAMTSINFSMQILHVG